MGHGALILGHSHPAIVQAAHTKEDIDQTIEAFGDSLDAMIAEGTLR
jgi:glutamate-1-semialdehyde aminotransferase